MLTYGRCGIQREDIYLADPSFEKARIEGRKMDFTRRLFVATAVVAAIILNVQLLLCRSQAALFGRGS